MDLSGKYFFHQGLASLLSWAGHQGVGFGSSLDHARLDPVGSSWIDQQRDPSRAAVDGLDDHRADQVVGQRYQPHLQSSLIGPLPFSCPVKWPFHPPLTRGNSKWDE